MSAALAELLIYRTEKELGDTEAQRQKTWWIPQQQDCVKLLMPTLASCLLCLWYRHKMRWVIRYYIQPLGPQANDEFNINRQVNKG